MKKILSILMVALFATAMVSCDKHDDTLAEATANTLVYNGKVYQMTSTYKIEQSGRVYIDAAAVEADAEGLPIFSIIADNPDNGTYDLTQESVWFSLRSSTDEIPQFSSQDFASGTEIVEKDDNAFGMKVNGTLNSGATVSFYIYVPASEWEQLEW
ncbi:MAG: hypothetical protein IKM79_02155 [Bacteroidales bacterium]|nr:hypothetical protein [Bacteroidales bacterium]